MIYRLSTAAALCLLAACDDVSLSVVCPGDPSPAVVITVVDGEGGRSLAAEARGSFVVGTTSDSLRHFSSATDDGLFAPGPPGVYRVEVLVDGRAPWRNDGIQVGAGVCGPRTARLVADLPGSE